MTDLSPKAKVEFLLGALAACREGETTRRVRRAADTLHGLFVQHFSDQENHLEVVGLVLQAANDHESRYDLCVRCLNLTDGYPEAEDRLEGSAEAAAGTKFVDETLFGEDN